MKVRPAAGNGKKGGSDSFRYYFDEQFPGPFAEISYDDLGPIVILPEPSFGYDDDGRLFDHMTWDEMR